MLPQYMRGDCNLNIPSSCVQESRPLLTTGIRSGSGLPVLSPRLAGPMHLAGREALGEMDSCNFSHVITQAGLAEMGNEGWRSLGVAGSFHSERAVKGA